MDNKTALEFALAALQALPALIRLTEEASKLIDDTITSIKAMQEEDRDPTSEEWDALNANIEALQAQRDEATEDGEEGEE